MNLAQMDHLPRDADGNPIEGTLLPPLEEPGSDQLLSDEVKERIEAGKAGDARMG